MRPPPAGSPLARSVAEQLAELRGPDADPPPDALLDVVTERMRIGEERLIVARPADWQALREAERDAGRPVPYWAVPWPSGKALARAVLADPPARGARVLELGCGLGLPSVVAARAGAQVLATDASAEAVVFAAHTLALNDALGDVGVASWQEAGETLAAEPWDLVLAADVLYLRENVEALLRLLPRLLGPDGEAWIADPGRAGAEEFLPSAKRIWQLRSERAPDDDRVRLHRLHRR
jgi:predicted nicotinamide N-methyase